MSSRPLGTADQACKECRRRKAKCTREIPTCSPCARYRRHCLYEKHARTALTRRHLTEVEERLEAAEALVTRLRALVPAGAELSAGSGPVDAGGPITGSGLDGPPGAEASAQNMLEVHPVDDFEWDELDRPAWETYTDEQDPLADGMASLSVGERESGYLGVASGAALLRLLEPARRRTPQAQLRMLTCPDPNRHIADAMLDAYFRLYHLSYPIVHEATFRAQYAGVIPRPNGDSWSVLAYVVAAIGVFSSATDLSDLDTELFAQARSILNFNFLEMGNMTIVQALTLISNYKQKRDRPNSGYNYLGLAVRMAMGLGLHKEFGAWRISPLQLEMRRRVWWTMSVFDVGASVTFSRPNVFPYEAVDVALPLNVDDRKLTALSQGYPDEDEQATPYTAVRTQASFHIATTPLYTRLISKPMPGADEVLRLESELVEPWRARIPGYFSEDANVPQQYVFARCIMYWRYRNLRIIMYRPFVIRRALAAGERLSTADDRACEVCIDDARATIDSIASFWDTSEQNRLCSWYCL